MKKVINFLIVALLLLFSLSLTRNAQAAIPDWCRGTSSSVGNCQIVSQCIEPGPSYEIAWSETTTCPAGNIYLEFYEASSYSRNQLELCNIDGNLVWCAQSYTYYYNCAQAKRIYSREAPISAVPSCDANGCYDLNLLGSSDSETNLSGVITYNAPRQGLPDVQFVCWDQNPITWQYFVAGYPPASNVYLVSCVDDTDCTGANYCDNSGSWDSWQCRTAVTPTVDLQVDGSSGPITIDSGKSVTLSWTTTNRATSCTASGDWSGSKTPSGGTETTGALTGPNAFVYNITCTNNAGSASDSVIVNVNSPPPNPPANLTASCPSPGTSASLGWANTTNATFYTLRVNNLTDAWDGSCSSSSGDFCATTSSPSYTFSSTAGDSYQWWVHACNNAGCSQPVFGPNFTCIQAPPPPPPPPTVTLTGNGSAGSLTLNNGDSLTLSWSTTSSPTSCSASGDWSGAKDPGGGSNDIGSLVGPNSLSYTLSCSNSGGSGSDSLLVEVSSPTPQPTPEVRTVTINPDPIPPIVVGQSLPVTVSGLTPGDLYYWEEELLSGAVTSFIACFTADGNGQIRQNIGPYSSNQIGTYGLDIITATPGSSESYGPTDCFWSTDKSVPNFVSFTRVFEVVSAPATPQPTPVSTPISTPVFTPRPPQGPNCLTDGRIDIGKCFGFGNIFSLSAGTLKLVPATFSIALALVILYFLFGAFRYLKAGGDKEELAASRSMIVHAIIGFFLLMLTFVVLQFVLSGLFGLTDFRVIQ